MSDTETMRRTERPTVPAPYTRIADEIGPAPAAPAFRRGDRVSQSDGYPARGTTIPMPFGKGW